MEVTGSCPSADEAQQQVDWEVCGGLREDPELQALPSRKLGPSSILSPVVGLTVHRPLCRGCCRNPEDRVGRAGGPNRRGVERAHFSLVPSHRMTVMVE